MTIAAGTKLGPYEITGAIGAGGMGEVYRARDPKLGRDVAIKVLPEAFARDTERMARFQREAKVLASLSHPNIATIYGLEDSGSTRALVMELVEGPTLADRIKQGPIPVDEAVRIARQIADALEYAHERGIIHRDLKPANVKVTNDDAVKVLDFGLAKALEGDPSSIDISTSPTISRMATQQGVLLGTAAYMAPEQAKAKSVDRRADIWAFGCVLYEMLTGKQAFTGETVTDTLASIIKEEPDWKLLPAATPMRVRVLLQRCLQKDPKQRLRDIGDARISLDEVLFGSPEPSNIVVSPTGARAEVLRRIALWSIIASLILAALASYATWNLKPSHVPPRPVTRFTITLPQGQRFLRPDQPALALSPDGSKLAYVAAAQDASQQNIYLRAMDSAETKVIAGTEGATEPFFSPDGQWLGFFADGKLKKISVNGTVAQVLADVPAPFGGSWGNQNTIVFTPGPTTLLQVSDRGGAPLPVTHLEKGELGHFFPQFLPDSKTVVFEVAGTAGATIAVQQIGTSERRHLIEGQDGRVPQYASSGHLIYSQAGNLMAASFDLQRLEVKGASVPVVQGVLEGTQYSISSTGTLAYVPGSVAGAEAKLVWVSRNGAEQPLAAPAHDYNAPRISPDGHRLAVDSGNQVWLYDLARDTLTRFTFEGTINQFPTWSPDEKRVAFTSNKEGGPLNIYWQRADGSGGLERLTTSEHFQIPCSWSPDGQLLTFFELSPKTAGDIWVLRISERKAQPFLQTPAFESAGQLSPDGHWVAYTSDESARREVYVQPYPGPGGKWQISTDGGNEPVWNHNGRELFYRSGDKIMAVEITTQPSFTVGKPKMLFEGPYKLSGGGLANYDVAADGQRFLMVKPVGQEQAATQIDVVLNWTEELKRLVPTGK
jgi:eukaryotic-like serine/threonine-protein kinase